MAITDLPVFAVSGAGVESEISDGHIKHILTFNKGVEVTDITDEVEIESYKTDGSMVLSPVINGTLPTTNDSEEISEPCTSPVPTDSERVITFTSMRTDVDGEEDFDYWDAVDCLTGDYTYGFIDCDGNLILNKDYATSLTVGFPAIGKVKAIWDATNARKWEGELKWKETCTNAVRRIILTDAVKAAIGL